MSDGVQVPRLGCGPLPPFAIPPTVLLTHHPPTSEQPLPSLDGPLESFVCTTVQPVSMNFGIGMIVHSFTAGSFLLSELGFTENHHLAFPTRI